MGGPFNNLNLAPNPWNVGGGSGGAGGGSSSSSSSSSGSSGSATRKLGGFIGVPD